MIKIINFFNSKKQSSNCLPTQGTTQESSTKTIDLLALFKSNISENLQIDMSLGAGDMSRHKTIGSGFENIMIMGEKYTDNFRGEDAPIEKAMAGWVDHVFAQCPDSGQAFGSKEKLKDVGLQGLTTLTFLTPLDPNNSEDVAFQDKLFGFASQHMDSFSWKDVIKHSITEFQQDGAIESTFKFHLMGRVLHLNQRYITSKIEDKKVTFAVSRQFFHS